MHFVKLQMISYKNFKDRIRDTMIIALIMLIIFFVTDEILIRIFDKWSSTMFVASENQELVYELNKNYAGINSFGMKDEDISVASTKDLYKIAVIKDSHAYSDVQNIAETFPSQLEKYLNKYI